MAMFDQPRPANRDGEVLLGNWVEERNVRCYQPEGMNEPNASHAVLFKDGNKGILTTKLDAKVKETTTNDASYTVPKYPSQRIKGSRMHLIEQTLAQRFRNELHEKLAVNPSPPEPTDYNTSYTKTYNKPGFVPTIPEPTRPHNVNTEMSISYWSEHADKVHGVSEINRKNDSFKKNTHFSTPITEKYDDALHIDVDTTL